LSYDFDGSDPGYPFLLRVELTYVLDKKSRFTVTTKATNLEKEQPLPFSNSWHSYFFVSDISKAVLTLDRCSSWNHIRVSHDSNKESDLIPTGLTEPFIGFDGTAPIGGTTESPTYWDDEFKMTASAKQCPDIQTKVTDPATRETTVLFSDEQFRWIQVFTGVWKQRMSAEADVWNNMQGMRLLQAGESWEGTFGVRLERSPHVVHLSR